MKTEEHIYLVRGLVSDFVSDIRTTRKLLEEGIATSDNRKYLRDVTRDLRMVIKNRHDLKFDKFGWPICLKEASE